VPSRPQVARRVAKRSWCGLACSRWIDAQASATSAGMIWRNIRRKGRTCQADRRSPEGSRSDLGAGWRVAVMLGAWAVCWCFFWRNSRWVTAPPESSCNEGGAVIHGRRTGVVRVGAPLDDGQVEVKDREAGRASAWPHRAGHGRAKRGHVLPLSLYLIFTCISDTGLSRSRGGNVSVWLTGWHLCIIYGRGFPRPFLREKGGCQIGTTLPRLSFNGFRQRC